MRITSILMWVVLFSLVGESVTALAQSEQTERLLLRYNQESKAQLLSDIAKRGGTVQHDFDQINTLSVTMPTTFLRSGVRMTGVTNVAIDPPVYPMVSGDPQKIGSFVQQTPWGVTFSGAPNVWEIADGSGMRVCIIDTGLDRTHEDIQYNNIIGGYSGVLEEAWFDDRIFHGTAVVGVINATNNDVGVIGVAPGNVELLVADIFANDAFGGDARESDILAAAEWCQENDANIINMSLGTSSESSGGSLSQGFQQIYNSGILMIAAAGNHGLSTGSTDWGAYPASYDSIISVGSADIALTHSYSSPENDQIELSAPGASVTTTSNEPEVVRFNDETLSANVIFNADTFGMYTATFVDGGSCNDPVPAGTYTGRIVLCERGDALFRTKIDNVAAGDGIAAIVYNSTTSPSDGSFIPSSQNVYGTYGDPCCAAIPSVTLNRDDGLMLLSNVGQEVTIEIGGNNYVQVTGTSFAAPHVTGGAAVLWSACPSLTNDQIRAHLAYFANDLGGSGRDISYGYGFLTVDHALYALFDEIDTYTQFNGDGDTPANVECPTDPPVNIAPTPTNTAVPPTATSLPPTNTPIPPTNTPIPPTDIPPTNTPVPPSATPLPPTNTAVPPSVTPLPPTSTPVPPTGVPTDMPTDVPPTDTPPEPTNTPPEPTNTPIPSPDVPSIKKVIYSSDFEEGNSWPINPNGTDSATAGFWEAGDPIVTGGDGGDNGMQVEDSYSGLGGMFTGLAGGSIMANDIDGGSTSFQSPAILLPDNEDVLLSFAYYLAYTNATADDSLRVSIINSTGTDILLEETGADGEKAAAWKTAAFSLNKYAGEDVQLLIEAADLGEGSVVEAGFDAVEIAIQGESGMLEIPLNVTVNQVDARNVGWMSVIFSLLLVGCAAVTIRIVKPQLWS